jgi:sugar lactone lactonase YvrE
MKVLLSSLVSLVLVGSAFAQAPAPAKPADPKPAAAAPAAGTTYAEGFSTPESVFYDAENDVYLVSNINGAPLAKDNNGYIAVVSPDDTKAAVTRLVEGGKNKATLNAPKGMAIVKGVLYVADIDTVRMFDRKTGAPKGELAVPGATFLNDLAAAPDGTVYFTDSGLKQGAKDFEPSGADGIYAIKDGKLTAVLKDKNLGKPNGLLVNGDNTLTVVNFGNNELWSLDLKKKAKGAVTKLPKGSLDGLVMLSNGDLLVSSWEANAIFRGKPGGAFVELRGGLSAPADIGFDPKRNRVLVPRFMDNRVETYPVSVSAAPPALAP